MANGHWPLLLYKPYTSDTRGVKAFQSYTALYSAIQYTAIHRYTVYNLYITPLGVLGCPFYGNRSPSKGVSKLHEQVLSLFELSSQPQRALRKAPLPDYAGASRLLRWLGSCE